MDELPIPVFVKDARHRWIYGNSAFSELIGIADFLDRDDTSIFNDEQVEVFWKEDDLVFSGEVSANFEEIGDGVFALTRKYPIKLSNGKPGLIGLIIEAVASPQDLINTRNKYRASQNETNLLVSQLNQKAEEHSRRYETRLRVLEDERATAQSLAQTDPLTGLRNRLGFHADMQAISKLTDKESGSFTLAFIDLDDFKHINDTFGHMLGDRILETVSARLKAFDQIFSVSRLGGDEFAILMKCSDKSSNQVKANLNEIVNSVFQPVNEFGREIGISGSLGFTRSPFDTQNLTELRRYADLALMKAKTAGKSRVRKFHPSDHSADVRIRTLEAGLKNAIQHDTLSAVYQPIFAAGDGTIRGVEVLARWDHPELGKISPDEFIPVARRLGLLAQLDEVVLRHACEELAGLLDEGAIDYFSVNTCPSDIASRGYAENFLKILCQFGIEPGSVVIEIIETAIMDKSATARSNLNRLSGSGIKIALDDFGSGYANYRTLLDLPINVLKVDRSLISTINEKPHLVEFLTSIVNMARALGASTICEGIETKNEKRLAQSLGFDSLQGFLVGKPVALSELRAALAKREITAQKIAGNNQIS